MSQTGETTLVTYLIDATWYEMESPPFRFLDPMLNGLRKILTDGRLLVRAGDTPADLRITPPSSDAREPRIEIAYPEA